MSHVSLQSGLYDLCRIRISRDPAFRETAANRNFTDVDDALFDEYRLHQLQKELTLVYEKSAFYRRRFDEYGVLPSDLTCLEDLAKFPFTCPEDLSGNSYSFLCTSQGDVEKPVTFYSSGSTGLKKRIFFSKADIRLILDFMPRGMNTVIGRNECRAQIFLQNSMGRGIGQILADSLAGFGMQAWTSNMEDDPEEILKVTLDHHVNVWFGDATTIVRATRILAQHTDLASLGMRCIFITMANIPDSMVDYLEKTWNCRVSTHYGMTEMGWGFAVDCDTCPGYHYNELDVIAEIVDPATGRVLPYGESGEVVLTSISRQCMPLIRFRTGDISRLLPCACGGHMDVLGHIEHRLEGAYTIGGTELFTAMFDEPLYQSANVLDYRLWAEGDQIHLDLEVLKDAEGTCRDVLARIRKTPELAGILPPVVRAYPVGALRKYCYEKKRIMSREEAESRPL